MIDVLDTMTLAEKRILGAYKLAMRELGIPDHPNGECPSQPCNCTGKSSELEARARGFVPGIERSALCVDCLVLIPSTAGCYWVGDASSGGVNLVCVPCGEGRNLSHEHRMP